MARAQGSSEMLSDTTLARLPARALTFLLAISNHPPICALLYEAGFRREDHAEGWRLLNAVGALPNGALTAPSTREPARDASILLSEWARTHFRRYRAALTRLHPEWVQLFPEINVYAPARCLLAIGNLTRELTYGRATRDPNLRATLALRGLDEIELERLVELVRVAESVNLPSPALPTSENRTQALLELYDWYRDWIESAKRFVRRRDYRTTLGIGQRRDVDVESA